MSVSVLGEYGKILLSYSPLVLKFFRRILRTCLKSWSSVSIEPTCNNLYVLYFYYSKDGMYKKSSQATIPLSFFFPVIYTHKVFRTWLGQDQDYLGESPEWLFRYLLLLKRATVGVPAPYATRQNSGMKRIKCGWTQPLFRKVRNHQV